MGVTTEGPDRRPRDVVKRRVSRVFAIAIAHAMAEGDVTFADMASRLGSSPEQWRLRFTQMLEGEGGALEWASDMIWACGGRLQVRLAGREED